MSDVSIDQGNGDFKLIDIWRLYSTEAIKLLELGALLTESANTFARDDGKDNRRLSGLELVNLAMRLSGENNFTETYDPFLLSTKFGVPYGYVAAQVMRFRDQGLVKCANRDGFLMFEVPVDVLGNMLLGYNLDKMLEKEKNEAARQVRSDPEQVSHTRVQRILWDDLSDLTEKGISALKPAYGNTAWHIERASARLKRPIPETDFCEFMARRGAALDDSIMGSTITLRDFIRFLKHRKDYKTAVRMDFAYGIVIEPRLGPPIILFSKLNISLERREEEYNFLITTLVEMNSDFVTQSRAICNDNPLASPMFNLGYPRKRIFLFIPPSKDAFTVLGILKKRYGFVLSGMRRRKGTREGVPTERELEMNRQQLRLDGLLFDWNGGNARRCSETRTIVRNLSSSSIDDLMLYAQELDLSMWDISFENYGIFTDSVIAAFERVSLKELSGQLNKFYTSEPLKEKVDMKIFSKKQPHEETPMLELKILASAYSLNMYVLKRMLAVDQIFSVGNIESIDAGSFMEMIEFNREYIANGHKALSDLARKAYEIKQEQLPEDWYKLDYSKHQLNQK